MTEKTRGGRGGHGSEPKEDDGLALWRAITETVQPLKHRIAPIKPGVLGNPAPQAETPKTRKGSEKQRLAVAPLPTFSTPPKPRIPPIEAGIDKRTADRLRKGRLPIEGRLDLHGHSRESAHRAVLSFIDGSHAAGKRCVLIVTGKGKGILQSETPRWLTEPGAREKIVSVRAAQPKDGGSGALYVLLKRHRTRGDG